MVHALEEIHRTLRPGALLVDLRPYHPYRPLELIDEGVVRELGRMEEGDGSLDAASDAALSEVFQRGLFALESVGSFYRCSYWDTAEELREYVEENFETTRLPRRLAGEARRAIRAAGRSARLRLQAYIVVTRLRKAA